MGLKSKSPTGRKLRDEDGAPASVRDVLGSIGQPVATWSLASANTTNLRRILANDQGQTTKAGLLSASAAHSFPRYTDLNVRGTAAR